ncbi:15654_t:CDS:1 [Racocetra fulgida]|uniref:15654_t:CDS:1 n=1 Tax=Racocetra fulgida TaxID=60492 RepID=A0A9N8WK18_9GLOM|nr:15654_t:CDS:1 [Racocetra fulgida]
MNFENSTQSSKIPIDIHIFQELIQYKEDAIKLEFEKSQYILEIDNLKQTIENLNNNILAVQYNNSIEISTLKNMHETEISNLKNKNLEILQTHQNEILNLKKYYNNEILNIKTYYENEILNLKNYNNSEILNLKNHYNKINNDYKTENINLITKYNNEILDLKNNYNIEILNLQNKQNIKNSDLKNQINFLEKKLQNLSIELFSDIFKNNIDNLSNLLYKKQYEEKCLPPTDPEEFIKMVDSFELKPFVLLFFNAFKSDNQNANLLKNLRLE